MFKSITKHRPLKIEIAQDKHNRYYLVLDRNRVLSGDDGTMWYYIRNAACDSLDSILHMEDLFDEHTLRELYKDTGGEEI